MKSERQAKLWRSKVPFFNHKDTQIRTIKISESLKSKPGKVVYREVLAVVRENLALHACFSTVEENELSDDFFQITHLQSGMLVTTFRKSDTGSQDFEFWNKKAGETWENWYPDNAPVRKKAGLPLKGNVND